MLIFYFCDWILLNINFSAFYDRGMEDDLNLLLPAIEGSQQFTVKTTTVKI